MSVSILPGMIGATDRSSKIAKAVDQAYRPLMEQHGIPGMAVAVLANDQQYFFSYGLASKSGNRPVKSETLFEIGSLSKTFTAILFGYAQSLGKISLGDHPGKYMPELRGHAIDRATLLHLGTYTAGGLPLQFPDGVRMPDMIPFFQEWKPTAAPGSVRLYSNPSIGLFGHVTALAMGGDFADVAQAAIADKLGLAHSYISVPQPEMDNYAWGYNSEGKAIRVNPGIFDAEAYGVKSTIADMARFVELNIRPEKLNTATRRAVEATQIGYFRVGEMVQGLGWEQYAYPLPLENLLAGNSGKVIMEPNSVTPFEARQNRQVARLFNKTGSTGGFGAYIAFVPERKIGVVMLANKNFPIPARVTAAHAVLEQLTRLDFDVP